MAETFTWDVDTDSSGKAQHRVASAQFGDGYTQIAPEGINTKTQVWSVKRFCGEVEAQEIVDFLDANAGRSFLWTPPLSVEGYYICNEYDMVPVGGINYTLSANFRQVFQP